MEAKVAKILGIKASKLVEKVKEIQDEKNRLKEIQALQGWIEVLDRLPTPNDQLHPGDQNPELWREITQLDLKGRYDLLSKYNLQITNAEYDYHYQYVANRRSVGTGYWRDFNNLEQFVLRHANALGEPEWPSKQVSACDWRVSQAMADKARLPTHRAQISRPTSWKRRQPKVLDERLSQLLT